MMAIKIILSYLKGIGGYGLWYKLRGNLDLKVFNDVDQAGNLDDRKSTGGGAFFLGKGQYLGQTKGKNYTSQSTTKAEHVAIVVNFSNIVWFK